MTNDIGAKYAFWVLLSLPLATTVLRYVSTPDAMPGDLLHPTGEWSARFVILALIITPLCQLWPTASMVLALARHRRALGVAAFLYALVHSIAYVLDMETVANMLAELGTSAIWSGWAALLILVPLGLTSNDAAVRMLKAGWKPLQRLAYPAAVFTLIHWTLIHDGLLTALTHFVPLAVLQGWRLARLLTSRSRSFA